ncbi:MAG: type II toxin-antitoxin system HicB family antitoxin [Candidatus Peregrinibacteria bacterium]
MQFPALIYQDEDGMFIGEIPTLKGVGSFGKTLEELEKNLEEAIALFLEVKMCKFF